MKGTTQIDRTPAMGLAQFASTMQARVAVRLDLIGSRTNQQEGQVSDVVDVVVADLGDLFFKAHKLPDAAPQLLDFEVVPGLRVIHRCGNLGVAWRHVRLGA